MSQKSKITKLKFQNQEYTLNFIESSQVKEGVTCDVYSIQETDAFDLGVVFVEKGKSTPNQKVLKGEKTFEIFEQGEGSLIINKGQTDEEVYAFSEESENMEITVNINQTMQWQASDGSDLMFYEICYPPYQDGRFENIEE